MSDQLVERGSSVENQNPARARIKFDSLAKMLDELSFDFTDGCRIVPFLGAGLSVPSGIPTTRALGRQLGRYVAHAVSRQESGTGLSWNPRKDPWPSMSELMETQITDPWVTLTRLVTKEKDSSWQRIYRMACGRAEDWKDSLQFLAQLEWSSDHPTLLSTDNSVIDHFFRSIVSSKVPNLGHRMLVSLSKELGMDLFLTTNFDELIEDAFAIQGETIAPFEVHRDASLPSSRLVVGQRSLVKLHGGRYGLRADMTVDALPSTEDVKTFLEYLNANSPTGHPHKRSILLVAGIAASDRRVMELIKAALAQGTKVYWAYFTNRDEREIKTAFSNLPQKATFLAAQHSDLGLFLLELYQKCVGSIPASVLVFPAVWNIPVPPSLPLPPTRNEKYLMTAGALTSRLDTHLKPGEGQIGNRLRIISLEPSNQGYGAATLGSSIFNDKAGDAFRVWLDIDDISEPVGIFLRLILAMRQMTGAPDPLTSLELESFYGDRRSFIAFNQAVQSEIGSIVTNSMTEWIVFLNAVEAPGQSPFTDPAARARWKNSEFRRRIWECMCGLGDVIKWPMAVVVLGKNKLLLDPNCKKRFHIETLSSADINVPFNPTNVVRATLESIKSRELSAFSGEGILLYILTIFRMARYKSMVSRVYEEYCAKVSQTLPKEGEIEVWINQFIKADVVRMKPGGIVWMNPIVRDTIRESLENDLRVAKDIKSRVLINSLIARAYGRMLLASGDPLAAFESLHHAVESLSVGMVDSRAESEDLEMLSIARHAQQIFRIGSDLLGQHLTEQFAQRRLAQLQQAIQKVLERHTQRGSSRKIANSCREVLHACFELFASVVDCRLRITEIQGQLDSFRQTAAETRIWLDNNHNGLTEWRAIGERTMNQIRLYEVICDICERKYGRAAELIHSLWTVHVLNAANRSNRKRDYIAELTEMDSGKIAGIVIARIKSDTDRLPDLKFCVQIVRRYVYLLLHQAQAKWLSIKQPHDSTHVSNVSRILRAAENMCHVGLNLLRSLPTDGGHFVFYENARLRAHYSLVLARRACQCSHSVDHDGRQLQRAEAILCDAESFVSSIADGADSLTSAVIEIRRAEVQLLGAGSVRPFRELRRAVIAHRITGKSIDDRERQQILDALLSKGSNVILAPIAEVELRVGKASRAVQRARELLSKHPKSVWWRQIAATLCVKCCEYSCAIAYARNSGLDSETRVSPDGRSDVATRDFEQFLATRLLTLEEEIAELGPTDGFQIARMLEAAKNASWITDELDFESKSLQSFLQMLQKMSDSASIKDVQEVDPDIWTYLNHDKMLSSRNAIIGESKRALTVRQKRSTPRRQGTRSTRNRNVLRIHEKTPTFA